MERSFKIFYDVELDTLRAQQLQRAARIPSARVMIQRHLFHGCGFPPRRAFPARGFASAWAIDLCFIKMRYE